MPGLIFSALLLAGMYFVIIRPQQQRVRQHAAVVSSVAVGDEIVSAGGIVGVVRSIGERDVEFEIAPGVVVTLAKGAIAQKAPAASESTELSE